MTQPAQQPDNTLPYEPPPPLETAPPDEPHDPYAALRIPNYRRYFIGNAFSLVGQQMAGITLAQEIYERTGSPAALGMVGLVQIIPIFALTLPAGHIVDHANRKRLLLTATALLILSYTTMGLCSAFSPNLPHAGPVFAATTSMNHGIAALAAVLGDSTTRFTDPYLPILFLLLFLNGMVRSVNQPAKQALLPLLVPMKTLHNAITWNSSAFETCTMTGPVIAGGLLAVFQGKSFPIPGSAEAVGYYHGSWAFAAIYLANAFCQLIQFINVSFISFNHSPQPRQPVTLKSLLVGFHFVYGNKLILGAITLDLFAVLFGGATVLLPLYAHKILHVGNFGLGWLRAAPSIGAITMALIMAHAPPMKNAGRNLLLAVTGFGIATIIFGFSQIFWLSILALIITGACDNISVVVRHTLVQFLTPDNLRGRVSAVNSVFISASNELGDFESGATTSIASHFLGPLWGPMTAVAGGGAGTLLVVAAIIFVFPQVAAIRKIQEAKLTPA